MLLTFKTLVTGSADPLLYLGLLSSSFSLSRQVTVVLPGSPGAVEGWDGAAGDRHCHWQGTDCMECNVVLIIQGLPPECLCTCTLLSLSRRKRHTLSWSSGCTCMSHAPPGSSGIFTMPGQVGWLHSISLFMSTSSRARFSYLFHLPACFTHNPRRGLSGYSSKSLTLA